MKRPIASGNTEVVYTHPTLTGVVVAGTGMVLVNSTLYIRSTVGFYQFHLTTQEFTTLTSPTTETGDLILDTNANRIFSIGTTRPEVYNILTDTWTNLAIHLAAPTNGKGVFVSNRDAFFIARSGSTKDFYRFSSSNLVMATKSNDVAISSWNKGYIGIGTGSIENINLLKSHNDYTLFSHTTSSGPNNYFRKARR